MGREPTEGPERVNKSRLEEWKHLVRVTHMPTPTLRHVIELPAFSKNFRGRFLGPVFGPTTSGFGPEMGPKKAPPKAGLF